MNFLQNFIKNIKKANKIAIFTHKDSDHDTICSAVALKEIIKQMGKKSVIFVDKKPSESILKFVPKEKFLTTTDEKFDVAICVDCSSIKRLSDANLKIFSSEQPPTLLQFTFAGLGFLSPFMSTVIIQGGFVVLSVLLFKP